MRRLLCLLVIASASAAGGARAEAPSFDCRAASSRVEKAICADPALSALDAEMARAFAPLVRDPATAGPVRAAQRAWLARRDRCTQAACIEAALRARLAELKTAAPATVAVGDDIVFGSRQGMELTVVSVRGLGTAHAAIDARQTERNAAEYCTGYVGEQTATAGCIAERMKEVGPAVMALRADCRSGDFEVYGERRIFLGRNGHPEAGRSAEQPEYLIKDSATGEVLGDYMATGYFRDVAVFRALCPGAAEKAPVVGRPHAFPPCDDEDTLARVRRLAVEAGVAHVMNVRIIDLSDVRTVSETSTEKRCAASVMLNVGRDAVLRYRMFVRSGKFFLETRLD